VVEVRLRPGGDLGVARGRDARERLVGADLDGGVADAGAVALDLGRGGAVTAVVAAVVAAAAGAARRHEQRRTGQGDDGPGQWAGLLDPHEVSSSSNGTRTRFGFILRWVLRGVVIWLTIVSGL
jgi:hypothetical protein